MACFALRPGCGSVGDVGGIDSALAPQPGCGSVGVSGGMRQNISCAALSKNAREINVLKRSLTSWHVRLAITSTDHQGSDEIHVGIAMTLLLLVRLFLFARDFIVLLIACYLLLVLLATSILSSCCFAWSVPV